MRMRKRVQTEKILAKMKNDGCDPQLIIKAEKLCNFILKYPSAVVAYSGGVDSTFLASWTYLLLDDQMRAVTVFSTMDSREQLFSAMDTAFNLGIPNIQLVADILANPMVKSNPVDRCFHCKKMIMELIWSFARENGFTVVMEGQNIDDLADYRPGRKAVELTKTISPLVECGFSKNDIRALSKWLDLPTWDKPSSPCLATRVPYGIPLNENVLTLIDTGEKFLRDQGYNNVRIRWGNDICIIEVAADEVQKCMADEDRIQNALKELGFNKVQVDPKGYRMGSLNEGVVI